MGRVQGMGYKSSTYCNKLQHKSTYHNARVPTSFLGGDRAVHARNTKLQVRLHRDAVREAGKKRSCPRHPSATPPHLIAPPDCPSLPTLFRAVCWKGLFSFLHGTSAGIPFKKVTTSANCLRTLWESCSAVRRAWRC
eukprot:1136333-Pelagomonas_calceolata.AAC.3